MLRGFFLIFILIGIAIVAVFGFRGQTSTGSPIEVFPDMVRQMKVRAQALMAAVRVRPSRARCRSVTKCRNRTAKPRPARRRFLQR